MNKLLLAIIKTKSYVFIDSFRILHFKPLIFTIMCIFTLSACETTSNPPSADYPVTASYENTFLTEDSGQNNNNNSTWIAITLAAILGTGLILSLTGAFDPTTPITNPTVCYEGSTTGRRVVVACD